MGTDQNPAYVSSRGWEAAKLSGLWITGPEWLKDPDCWPDKIIRQPTKETEEEAKLTKEVLDVAVDTKDDLDQVLEKKSF